MAYRTGIDTNAAVKCPHCDETAPIADINRPYGWADCPGCGKHLRWREPAWSSLDVFALFGFPLTIDWDGQLIVESEWPVPEKVRDWLFRHQGSIREKIETSGLSAKMVYVGGSLNGQKRPGGYAMKGDRTRHHIGPRHWEVYECRDTHDPRRYYVGRATSEAKAKRGEFVESGSVSGGGDQ